MTKNAITATLLMAAVCAAANAKTFNKIARDTAATSTGASTQVLVQWNVAVGSHTRHIIAALGGKTVKQFKMLSQGVYVIPSSAIPALDSDPSVKYVSNDRVVRRKLAFSAAAINAQAAWNAGYNGAGIGVAIVDSGVNPSPDLGINGPAAVGPANGQLAALLAGANGPVGASAGSTVQSSIVFAQDFTGMAPGSPGYGADWYGHGQHIAGIIASNGSSSSCGNCTMSMVGIAPAASIIDLKVLDETGTGNDSAVIAAIDQAILLRAAYNIRVLNLSLGRPVYESYTLDPLCQAVEAAWKAGIVVVVAAGNFGRDNSFGNAGYGTITSPGNDPYALTVGAMKAMNTMTRSDDLVASYSSKGPTVADLIVKPDIVAPGNLVVSLMAQNGTLPLTEPQNAVPLSYYETNAPAVSGIDTLPPVPTDPTVQPPLVSFGPGYSQAYFTLSGTSMATAVVSGAVADLLQAHPNLTPDQVKVLLMQTAYKTFPTSSTVFDPATANTYVDYYDVFTIGAGYLDLQAALNSASQVPVSGNSISPTATYNPTSGTVSLMYDPNSVWVNQSVWPNQGQWGASSVWSSSVLAGNQAILEGAQGQWGASGTSAASSIFASQGQWGASSSSSESFRDGAESVLVTGEN